MASQKDDELKIKKIKNENKYIWCIMVFSNEKCLNIKPYIIDYYSTSEKAFIALQFHKYKCDCNLQYVVVQKMTAEIDDYEILKNTF